MYNRITLAEKTTPSSNDFSFGKIGDVLDTKIAAKYLQKKGLVGADQIKDAQPNTSDPNSIRTNQADWKISAIQHIVANAKRLGIKKREEVMANKEALTSTLDPKYRDAMRNTSFSTIHPNFWEVIGDSIIPEESSKDTSKMIAKK